jgi:hypothetical protein
VQTICRLSNALPPSSPPMCTAARSHTRGRFDGDGMLHAVSIQPAGDGSLAASYANWYADTYRLFPLPSLLTHTHTHTLTHTLTLTHMAAALLRLHGWLLSATWAACPMCASATCTAGVVRAGPSGLCGTLTACAALVRLMIGGLRGVIGLHSYA